MGLGILDVKNQQVPGTVDILERERTDGQPPPYHSNLKYDRSGSVPILLVPQPSDDPNDPLNWPLWKRDLTLFALSLVSVLCATTSSVMAAGTVTLSRYYKKSFMSIALLTGYHLCGTGIAGILIVPTARVWGKRHLFVLGHVLMVVSCAWAGASGQNYQSLLWARIFQGVALAPFEALVNAAVDDLFYVHERGKRMALSNVAVFGAAFLTPVAAGEITKSMGWPWTFYFIAIFTAAALPLTIFLVPETAFRRPNYLEPDVEPIPDPTQSEPTGPQKPEAEGSVHEPKQSSNSNGESLLDVAGEGTSRQEEIPARVSYIQTLKLFNERKTDEHWWKLLLRPFPLFFHPAVLWACLIQGVIIGWTVFIGVTLAAIFMSAPLWFEEDKTGYMYTGAFIGAMLGLVLSGLLSDSMNSLMIKLNKGRYEPEFRILLVIFQLIFCSIGMYGFGITANNAARYGWLPPDVFFCCVVIGMVMGAVASALYIVDAHRNIVIEAFTCMLIFKNIFSFVLTFYTYDWLVEAYVRMPFMAISSIQVAICALSIPMYIFGKWNRYFFSRYDILKMLGLW
ncbi:major facilitator superfamily domain-containing protein [Aspergillus cavernicola]|uniref:Major facilitator superfamily domain-containing protein n=1 Tax=Aspergillus cavernicola TaxID=176166 RepID=A0ABR4ILM5_9EURO